MVLVKRTQLAPGRELVAEGRGKDGEKRQEEEIREKKNLPSAYVQCYLCLSPPSNPTSRHAYSGRPLPLCNWLDSIFCTCPLPFVKSQIVKSLEQGLISHFLYKAPCTLMVLCKWLRLWQRLWISNERDWNFLPYSGVHGPSVQILTWFLISNKNVLDFLNS